MKSLVIFTTLYLLPSVIKPGKSKNKILNTIIFIVRLPGIAMRAALLSLSFFSTLLLSIIFKSFASRRENLLLPVAYTSHLFCRLFFGVTYKIENIEKLQKFKNGILILNHQSFFDGPFLCLLAQYTTYPFVGMAKKSLEKWPILGWYWNTIGGIFVNNASSDKAETEKSIEEMKKVCKRIKEDKISVLVFPEGHRNSEPKILEFKKGAFHMAYDSQVPLLPVVVQTYYDKIFACNFPWSPSTIILRVLDEVPTDNISNKDDITKITKETRDKMDNVLQELNKIDS